MLRTGAWDPREDVAGGCFILRGETDVFLNILSKYFFSQPNL